MKRVVMGVLVAALLTLAACGSGGQEQAATTAPATEDQQTTATPPTSTPGPSASEAADPGAASTSGPGSTPAEPSSATETGTAKKWNIPTIVTNPALGEPIIVEGQMGEPVKLDDREYVVHGVRRVKAPSALYEDGYWIAVDISAKNLGSKALELSSMVQTFILDQDNGFYNANWPSFKVNGTFDGAVEPGATRRGEVTFDLPASAKELYLVIDDTIFYDSGSPKKAVIPLGTVDK